MTLKKIRKVGIVGCGAVVQHFYIRHLARHSELKVTGVADLDVRQAAKVAVAFGCPVRPFDELVREIDLLIIATPPASHFSLAKAALEAPVDVMLEKPFVASTRQAEELCRLADANGKRVWVGQFRRLFPKSGLVRRFCASGLLGRLNTIEAFEGGRFNWATASGYVSRDPLGGVLFDTGAHTLDLALYATGMDLTNWSYVVRTVRRDKPEPAHEIDSQFELHQDGHVIEGRLFLSRLQSLANLVRLRYERGTVEFGIGPDGDVRVTGPSGGFQFRASEAIGDNHSAFAAQIDAVLGQPELCPLAGHRFLGQIRILEAILNHA
jgi:predicted dehydrogenase